MEYLRVRLKQDVAARLEQLVEFRGPETCAGVDVEDVASLILLQDVSNMLQNIVLDAISVLA
jgi:hypothetical protein